MAFDWSAAGSTLLGAAAAISGGLLAQRYEQVHESKRHHFSALQQEVLTPWASMARSRASTLSGHENYIGLNFKEKEYVLSLGVFAWPSGQAVFQEAALLTQASRRHWPALWAEWDSLNNEMELLAQRVISFLYDFEKGFPKLPPGKRWPHGDDPVVGKRTAIVNILAISRKRFERETYPDYVQGQLRSFSFWQGTQEPDEVEAYTKRVLAWLAREQENLSGFEEEERVLSARYAALASQIEDAGLAASLSGGCRYCPRFFSR